MGYFDSDYAYTNSAKSTTGKIIFYQNNPILWNSQIQKTVALSSMEAEYYGLTSIAKDILYFKQICNEINLPLNLPIKIKVDNQSMMKFAGNYKFSPRTNTSTPNIILLKI